MISDMLRSAASWGSAAALSSLPFSAAGKTGTVAMDGGGNRDAWTVAYTPKLTVCVWMGYDQPDAAHRLPDATGGGAEPARLAAAFLRANAKLAAAPFTRPPGLTEVLIDTQALKTLFRPMQASELTPSTYIAREIFPVGQAPTEISNVWRAPDPPRAFRAEAIDGFPRISLVAADEGALYLIHRKSGEEDIVIAKLNGLAGETVYFSDMEADVTKDLTYYAIPVNRALYEDGKILAGEPSEPVRLRPRRNGFVDFWGNVLPEDDATPAPSEAPDAADEAPGMLTPS
jgi:hypothetical protein